MSPEPITDIGRSTMKRVIHIGLTAVTASALVLSGGLAANAAGQSTVHDPRSPMEAVTAATPDTVANAAAVATGDAGGDAVSAQVAGTDITVPVDPVGGISLGQGDKTVSVGLPFAAGSNDATPQKNGVVSYDNNNGSTTVPVVQNDGTVQINTVIADASGPTRYAYAIDGPTGHSLHLNVDGSAYLADDAGSSLAQIAAPWATDSDNQPVATHYEVDGNVLTQVVTPTSSTQFPVVADPKITFGLWNAPYGPGAYINVTGAEMKAIALAVVTVAGGALIAGCTASKLPAVIAKVFSVACFVGGGAIVTSLLNTMASIANNGSFVNSTCYQTLVNGVHPYVATSASNCSYATY